MMKHFVKWMDIDRGRRHLSSGISPVNNQSLLGTKQTNTITQK